MSRIAAGIAVLGLVIFVSRPALAESVRLNVSADGDATMQDFVFSSIRTNSNFLATNGGFLPGSLKRGMMEFPVPAQIPANATITSATLNLSMNGMTYNDSVGEYPRAEFFAYTGNGTITLSDATAAADLVAQTPTIFALTPLNLALDTAALQGRFVPGGSLGIRAEIPTPRTGMDYVTIEGEAFYAASFPASTLKAATIDITYVVPEPSMGCVAIILACAAARRRR